MIFEFSQGLFSFFIFLALNSIEVTSIAGVEHVTFYWGVNKGRMSQNPHVQSSRCANWVLDKSDRRPYFFEELKHSAGKTPCHLPRFHHIIVIAF